MRPHRDLLAELELTMVPALTTRPDPGMYVPASGRPEAASRNRSCRRSFWCAIKEEGVEVEFGAKTFLGFPRMISVKSCSAFDEPEKVACGRRCLDSKFRRQWPPALPIADPRREPGA